MAGSAKGVLVAVLAFAGAASAGEVDDAIDLDGKHFKSFHQCGWSNAELERIMKSHPPIKRMDSAWIFRVRGEVMGLPMAELYIGVCGRDGLRACGPANAMSFIVDVPLEEARRRLKARYKTDFTQEKRTVDEIMGDSLPVRPHLFPTKDNRTALSCF